MSVLINNGNDNVYFPHYYILCSYIYFMGQELSTNPAGLTLENPGAYLRASYYHVLIE